jgi:hypothetical protein
LICDVLVVINTTGLGLIVATYISSVLSWDERDKGTAVSKVCRCRRHCQATITSLASWRRAVGCKARGYRARRASIGGFGDIRSGATRAEYCYLYTTDRVFSMC